MNIKKIITCLLCIFLLCSVPVFATGQDDWNFVDIYFNGMHTGKTACTIKGNVYITMDTLKTYGNCDCFTIDEDASQIVFNPATMNIFLGDAETTRFVKENAGLCTIPLKKIQGVKYVSLNAIADFAKLDYTIVGSNKLSNNDPTDITQVRLTPIAISEGIGKITSDNVLAVGSLMMNMPPVTTLGFGELAYLKSETASFYKIQTLDGTVCYVNKGDFEAVTDTSYLPDFTYRPKTITKWDTPFNLVWQELGVANKTTALPPSSNDGIDVVSPLFIEMAQDGSGNVTNYCDKGYIDIAHNRGYEVWMTVNNSFTVSGSSRVTYDVLMNEKATKKAIAQYILYACLYDVDGINFDWEDLGVYPTLSYSDMGDIKVKFPKMLDTLHYYTQKLGLVLSVDTPSIGNWARYSYDFNALADATDYICVMAYDETSASSKSVGAVCSKTWYDAKIKAFLDEGVPAEKLVFGMPLYTRIFAVDANGKVDTGKTSTIKINTQRQRMTEYGVTPIWNETAAQYYVEFPYDYSGTTFTRKGYLEDRRSLAHKAQAVLDNELAGAALWVYGQEEDGIFDMFHAVFHKGIDISVFDLPYEQGLTPIELN